MDATSIRLILDLICTGVGVASKHKELARRVRAGEVITDEEITEAKKEASDAVNTWDSLDGK